MDILTTDQIRKINKVSLGEKHGCSSAYVGKILTGEREAKSEKAKKILLDANNIIAVLEGEPENTKA